MGNFVNHTKFVLFSFLSLRNIRGTYSKYLENSISETGIYQQLKNKLPDVIFQKLYIHLLYVINH